MRLKQIESILKSCKTITVADGESCQWLGDGAAFYPIYNMPHLTQEHIFTMFDIAPDKRAKYNFLEMPLPGGYCFDDNCATENQLEPANIEFNHNGRCLCPLPTQNGLALIDTKYLRPFYGAEQGYTIYERFTPDGNLYLAIKEGFILCGIVRPFPLPEKLIDSLKDVLSWGGYTVLV